MRTYIGRFCLDCLETFSSIDHNQCIKHLLLPPANEVCEGYVFTGVCLSTGGEGACVVAPGGACMVAPGGGGVRGCSEGGRAWLLRGGMRGCSGGHAWLLWGGMCGCSGGAWLLPGGHAWLLPGGHAWLLGGACVVAPGVCVHGCSRGGMRGCSGGRAWFFR